MRPHTCVTLVTRPAWGFLGICLLAAAGCRFPAAGPYTAGADDRVYPRGLVLTGQLLSDTTGEVARHPLRSGWDNLWELKDHLVALADGVVYKRVVLHLSEPPGPPPAADLPPPEPPGTVAPGLLPAQVQLYPDGASALAALYQLIDQAQCRIDVLMFYWENDHLGTEVADRLAARAGPGLRVRVLVDGGGNLIFGLKKYAPDARYNRAVGRLLANPYVEVVRIRNPFGRFDHRKLVLVDGQFAWTGGRNFASSAFFEHHDISYTLAGPLACKLQECFDAYWKEQGARSPGPAPEPCLHIREPNAYVRLVATGPGRRQVAEALYRAIDGARHHVYVENVYFSDSRLICKLARARRRGVDVRAVLSFDTCSAAMDRSNRVVANRLLRAGIRVYAYPVMTHVKAATVDGCWAYLGTGNFDALSLRHNHEMGLVIGAGPLLAEVEARLFHADFQPGWELTRRVPVTWCDYLAELLASLAL